MGAGLRYVAMSPNIAKVMLRAFLFGLTAVAVMALLPLVARHLVAGRAADLRRAARRLRGRRDRRRLPRRPAARAALERVDRAPRLRRLRRLRRAARAQPAAPWSTAAGMLVGGACWVLALALFNTTVQLSTPRWVVGRALALYQTAAFGGMALGSWLWGSVAEAHGPAQALLVAGGGDARRPALVGLRLPLPDRAELNLDPLNRWTEPQVGARPQAAQRADHDRGRVPDRRGRRAGVPRRDGRAPAHPPARRRAALDAAARPRGPRALGRELPDPDLGRVRPPQPAPHPGRRRRRSTASASCTAAPEPPRVHRRIVRQAALDRRRAARRRRRSTTRERSARRQSTTTLAPMGTRS